MRLDSLMQNNNTINISKAFTQKHSQITCSNCKTKNNCLHHYLDHDFISRLPGKYVTKVKMKKGDPIIRNGDPLHHLYNVRIGYCKLEFSLSDGQYQINHFAFPGDLLGIDGIAEKKHRLDITALSDGELCIIEFNTLTKLIDSEPEIRNIFDTILGRTINRFEEHLFSLGSHSAEQKLAFFLLDFHKRQKQLNIDLRMMRLPMSREDLKSYLGMTSETLSRSFAFLEKNNYLQVKNRNISNINYDRLSQLIEHKEKSIKVWDLKKPNQLAVSQTSLSLHSQ